MAIQIHKQYAKLVLDKFIRHKITGKLVKKLIETLAVAINGSCLSICYLIEFRQVPDLLTYFLVQFLTFQKVRFFEMLMRLERKL